jgi:hypothetical protein
MNSQSYYYNNPGRWDASETRWGVHLNLYGEKPYHPITGRHRRIVCIGLCLRMKSVHAACMLCLWLTRLQTFRLKPLSSGFSFTHQRVDKIQWHPLKQGLLCDFTFPLRAGDLLS